MKTSKFYLNKSKFNAWLLCAFVIWHILLLKTTSKLSRFTVVKRMMVYNPNPGIHHIIHNFSSSFFFCAKNKLDWTIRDWTHFFQQKNYMCSNMHKCKKNMVFTFDKKILIIQQFMRVESAFDIAKNITFIIGTLLNVIYSKKF